MRKTLTHEKMMALTRSDNKANGMILNLGWMLPNLTIDALYILDSLPYAVIWGREINCDENNFFLLYLGNITPALQSSTIINAPVKSTSTATATATKTTTKNDASPVHHVLHAIVLADGRIFILNTFLGLPINVFVTLHKIHEFNVSENPHELILYPLTVHHWKCPSDNFITTIDDHFDLQASPSGHKVCIIKNKKNYSSVSAIYQYNLVTGFQSQSTIRNGKILFFRFITDTSCALCLHNNEISICNIDDRDNIIFKSSKNITQKNTENATILRITVSKAKTHWLIAKALPGDSMQKVLELYRHQDDTLQKISTISLPKKLNSLVIGALYNNNFCYAFNRSDVKEIFSNFFQIDSQTGHCTLLGTAFNVFNKHVSARGWSMPLLVGNRIWSLIDKELYISREIIPRKPIVEIIADATLGTLPNILLDIIVEYLQILICAGHQDWNFFPEQLYRPASVSLSFSSIKQTPVFLKHSPFFITRNSENCLFDLVDSNYINSFCDSLLAGDDFRFAESRNGLLAMHTLTNNPKEYSTNMFTTRKPYRRRNKYWKTETACSPADIAMEVSSEDRFVVTMNFSAGLVNFINIIDVLYDLHVTHSNFNNSFPRHSHAFTFVGYAEIALVSFSGIRVFRINFSYADNIASFLPVGSPIFNNQDATNMAELFISLTVSHNKLRWIIIKKDAQRFYVELYRIKNHTTYELTRMARVPLPAEATNPLVGILRNENFCYSFHTTNAEMNNFFSIHTETGEIRILGKLDAKITNQKSLPLMLSGNRIYYFDDRTRVLHLSEALCPEYPTTTIASLIARFNLVSSTASLFTANPAADDSFFVEKFNEFFRIEKTIQTREEYLDLPVYKIYENSGQLKRLLSKHGIKYISEYENGSHMITVLQSEIISLAPERIEAITTDIYDNFFWSILLSVINFSQVTLHVLGEYCGRAFYPAEVSPPNTAYIQSALVTANPVGIWDDKAKITSVRSSEMDAHVIRFAERNGGTVIVNEIKGCYEIHGNAATFMRFFDRHRIRVARDKNQELIIVDTTAIKKLGAEKAERIFTQEKNDDDKRENCVVM